MGKEEYCFFSAAEMAWLANYLGCRHKVNFYLGMKGKWAKLPLVRGVLLFLAGIRLRLSSVFVVDLDACKYDLEKELRLDLETLLRPAAMLQLAINPLGKDAEVINAHFGRDGSRVMGMYFCNESRTLAQKRMTLKELVDLVMDKSQLLPAESLPGLYSHPDMQIYMNDLVRITDSAHPKTDFHVSPAAQRIALVLSDLKQKGSVIIYYDLDESKKKQPKANGFIFLAGAQSGACFSFSPMVENARGVMFAGSSEEFRSRLVKTIEDAWRVSVPSPAANSARRRHA